MKMVRANDDEDEHQNVKARIFQFQRQRDGGRQTQSMADIDIDTNRSVSPGPENKPLRTHASAPLEDEIQAALESDETVLSPLSTEKVPSLAELKDMEAMKERFAKLLLGEDMSGGGKGAPSALALSNAITNLAASVFSEHKKLEPMPPEMKARWKKEIDWLLSVTDQIVEFAPSKQSKNGVTFEIMTTRQRTDLHMNIPALRKLDGMVIEVLENFKDQNEFSYMSKNATDSQKAKNKRNEDKWWVPTPKVPPNGLSDVTRKWLQFQKDSVNQVHKAAMAINAQILSEMEIPESYIESLPKNGKACLGDLIYKNITLEYFDPDYFLSSIDLSSEHKILDLKNRIEASIVIWRRKMTAKDGKSSWGSGVSLEKRELFEERLETILLILKHRFPGISQSSLDISKIEHNRDVGHAVLESYSRILESLAFTVMSRIEDVQHADETSRNPSVRSVERKAYSFRESPSVIVERIPNAKEEVEKINSEEAPLSMTLLDFMGWQMDQEEAEHKKEAQEDDSTEKKKIPSLLANKKFNYMDR
ncbi:rop guanine nucleotide exchange factor 12 [Daucus carota subsp. sativus]|uniref:rop guanine nucleotide exchange factor 12 n=1 Tax=Daucus carota subsp. sativus TaxID=79200 RepID=UPI0007EFE2E3|nr:PREDICTED: rop guanine nucleotide exchange factor 12 [Daucus carota subsp. sativus]XP_017235674.1 PREDICTED: rop guanine nucleotide exchange factor 12 [Daucus carota subsp. sativus]